MQPTEWDNHSSWTQGDRQSARMTLQFKGLHTICKKKVLVDSHLVTLNSHLWNHFLGMTAQVLSLQYIYM